MKNCLSFCCLLNLQKNNIKKDKTPNEINESYAYYMSEALRYAGLDSGLEIQMKKSVSLYLNKINSHFKDSMSKDDL